MRSSRLKVRKILRWVRASAFPFLEAHGSTGIEIVAIDPLQCIGRLFSNPNAILDHQLGQLATVQQDDLLAQVPLSDLCR
jgi:hypothetical protein